MPSSVTCEPRFFADDTCLVYSKDINIDLQNISIWFKSNKLTFNPSKSNVLIVPPKLKETAPLMNVSLNNVPINQSNSVKYLGVIIDTKLNFDVQINSITHKISKAVGVMTKLKHYLPQKALLTVYYSLVHTHLLYGLSVWGSAYKTHLKKLITLQNKAVKIIGGGSYRDKASPCYSDTKTLNLYKLEIGKFVHAHFQNKIPQKISKFFTLTRDISLRSTRSTQQTKTRLYIPRYPTSRLQKCIKYQGVTIWNQIPPEIQSAFSKLFKSKFKKHLLQLQI